jgi:hypothetical protein
LQAVYEKAKTCENILKQNSSFASYMGFPTNIVSSYYLNGYMPSVPFNSYVSADVIKKLTDMIFVLIT